MCEQKEAPEPQVEKTLPSVNPARTNLEHIMSRRFYEKDGKLEYLKGRTAAIIGYGSQGHAHALNLRDSGVDVVVSEAPGSPSWAKAEAAGLKVMTTAEAAKVGNVIMILVPDTIQAAVVMTGVEPQLTPGK